MGLMIWMPSSAWGQDDVIQMQPTNMNGINAELIQCKRKKGVLSIKVRFVNSGNDMVKLRIDTHHGAYDGFYVTAKEKKYFVLKDTEGIALAPKYMGADLKKGESYYWWAKFPAPPAEVKEVNIVIPQVLPFEDVEITDK
jgi:hypothetical protein